MMSYTWNHSQRHIKLRQFAQIFGYCLQLFRPDMCEELGNGYGAQS